MQLNILAIIVLGLGGGLLGLLGVVRGSWIRSRWFQLAPVAVALTAAALATFGNEPWEALIPICLAALWVCLQVSAAVCKRASSILARPIVAGGALLAASPLLAVAWSHVADSDPVFFEPGLILESIAEIERVNIPNAGVCTDTGRILSVAKPARPATLDEVELLKRVVLDFDMTCTDGPGADYNCHGWVFTGGRYWIRSAQVQEILDDNGYRPVADPKAGDVIVYWSNDKVVHSGVVRTVNADKVLVESKWGMQGRFIHVAEHQDYSPNFGYYRSERCGHLLQGIVAAAAIEQPVALSRISAGFIQD